MNWLQQYLAYRRRRKLSRFLRRMKDGKVVFIDPIQDSRSWSQRFMDSLRK